MRTVYCLLYESVDGGPDDVTQVHEVSIPDYGEKNYYNATTSLAWFRERESIARYSGKKIPCRWTSVRYSSEWESDQKFWKLCADDDSEQYADLPHFKHTSIFAYYEAVGYDKKRKKYTIKSLDKGNKHGK